MGKKARPSAKRSHMMPMRPRVFWPVVKAAGLLPMTVTFAALFVLGTGAIVLTEPALGRIGDAAWFLFTVITTIGLGDYTCTTVVGRLATIVMSLYSVFYIALITGAVVSYCEERIRESRNESLMDLIDELEHLPELSHEELASLSERVRRYRSASRQNMLLSLCYT